MGTKRSQTHTEGEREEESGPCWAGVRDAEIMQNIKVGQMPERLPPAVLEVGMVPTKILSKKMNM